MTNKIIAITGASGTVGSEVVKLLSLKGAQVIALSRHPEKGVKLPGVEWRKADLTNRTEMVDVLNGVDTLFLLTGNISDMVYAQKNGIRAARQAGVRKVVKLSALGASEHSMSIIGLWHHIVEQALENSGLEWVILRPHAFMQNFLDQKDSIKNGQLFSAAEDGKIPFIDSRNIAEVAAEVLTSDHWNKQKIILTGPDSLSFDDLAKIFSDELGYQVKHIRESEDETWQHLRREGKSPWVIAGQMALYNYWKMGGVTSKTTNEVEKIIRKKPYSVVEFLHQHKAKFIS